MVTRFGVLALCITAATAAAADTSGRVGEAVGLFVDSAMNYRLDLRQSNLVHSDVASYRPEARFAAEQKLPQALHIVMAEELGNSFTLERYGEFVVEQMRNTVNADETLDVLETEFLGERDLDGVPAVQYLIRARLNGAPLTYVVTAGLHGGKGYQLVTMSSAPLAPLVLFTGRQFSKSFSIIDHAAVAAGSGRYIVDLNGYRSDTFGYSIDATDASWVVMDDSEENYPNADFYAVSPLGVGAVFVPVCWSGDSPGESVLYEVLLGQVGWSYPNELDTETGGIRAGAAEGAYFTAVHESDVGAVPHHLWVVATDSCAYVLSGWGEVGSGKLESSVRGLLRRIDFSGGASATRKEFSHDAERSHNAALLNRIGMHLFDARSYLDAFRFFSQAADQEPARASYVTNALRALSDVEAYGRAADWLEPRLAPFANDQTVQSWVAWLAAKNGHGERAIEIYLPLFAAGFRNDDDFRTLATELAARERWDEFERAFAHYTEAGANAEMQRLKAELLSRRGRHDEALGVLERLDARLGFDADTVFARADILAETGDFVGVLRQADALIGKGYRSLASYYYKGRAHYELGALADARAAFLEAERLSPTNETVAWYLEAINLALGEGDIAIIREPIEPVALPAVVERRLGGAGDADGAAEAGAYYLARVAGFDYSGGDALRKTLYRRIRIVDDRGIEHFSTLTYNFDPAYESLHVNRVIVRDASGDVLAEASPDTFYLSDAEVTYEASTERTVHIPVPALSAGVEIEAVVTIRTSVDRGQFPLEHVYFTADRPSAYNAVFVRGETGQLAYASRGLAEPRRAGDLLVWELESPTPYRWEPFLPPHDRVLPWLHIGTVDASWADAGLSYVGKIEDKLGDESLRRTAERLIDGADDDAARVERLSAYVQRRIRYEAIEFGRRAYIPKTARDTLRDRYGDCKDHAVLLHELLQSVDIPSSLALVNLSRDVVPELPSVDQFDHMVVALPAADGYRFVDATDKSLSLRRLSPRGLAGGRALVLNDTPQLVAIPPHDAEAGGIEVSREVELGTDDRLRVRELAVLSGYQAANLRSQLRDIETANMANVLQGWLGRRYGDAELTDYLVENVLDAGNDLVLELTYELSLDDAAQPGLPAFIEADYLEVQHNPTRLFPFARSFPLHVSAVTSIQTGGARALRLPNTEDLAGASEFGAWERRVQTREGAVEVRFSYRGSTSQFSPEKYLEFSRFHRRAISAIELPLRLE